MLKEGGSSFWQLAFNVKQLDDWYSAAHAFCKAANTNQLDKIPELLNRFQQATYRIGIPCKLVVRRGRSSSKLTALQIERLRCRRIKIDLPDDLVSLHKCLNSVAEALPNPNTMQHKPRHPGRPRHSAPHKWQLAAYRLWHNRRSNGLFRTLAECDDYLAKSPDWTEKLYNVTPGYTRRLLRRIRDYQRQKRTK